MSANSTASSRGIFDAATTVLTQNKQGRPYMPLGSFFLDVYVYIQN
jgi:hypothetical protein